MADTQILVTFLACLCTFLLCIIFLPEITRWSTQRHGSLTQSGPVPATADVTGDGQIPTVTTVTELPASSRQRKLKQMLDILIDVICTGFSLTHFFQHQDAPRLFVVYAHDNIAYGKAHSGVVHDIIKLMEKIRSRTRSDKKPVLHSDGRKLAVVDDILTDQFCLLPHRIAIDPVDKVLLFYSEVLQAYYMNPPAREFVDKIKEAGSREIEKLRDAEAGNTVRLSKERIEDIHNAIRAVVDEHTSKPEFHHVLTEIALVELRTWADDNPLSIVPVALNSTSTTLADLTFLKRTQHCHTLPSEETARYHPSELTHRLFFKLLGRIYGRPPDAILWLQKLYYTGVEKLYEHETIPLIEFERQLKSDVFTELERAPSLTSTDTPWSHKSRYSPRRSPANPPKRVPEDILAKREQLELLRILELPEMHSTRQSIRRPYPGTIDWLFHHPFYRQWIEQDSGILGIRGGPGTGKSTVVVGLLERMESQAEPSHVILSFFFNYSAASKLSRTRQGMYRTLLYDLVQQVPSAVNRVWSGLYNAPIHSIDLCAYLIKMLSTVCKRARVRIFVDALDEAGDDEARLIIADLRQINREVGRISNGLSICFSCRYYPAIVVDNGLQIKLEENSKAEAYLHGLLIDNAAVKRNLNQEQVRALVEAILLQASGSFIWVMLVTKSVMKGIERGEGMEALKRRVYETPLQLNTLYSNILDTIHIERPEDRKIAIAIIRCLTFSCRSLTLSELRYALGSDIDLPGTRSVSDEPPAPIVEDDSTMLGMIEQYTKGLTAVQESTDANGNLVSHIRFTHFSVFEFFSRGENLHEFLPSALDQANWADDSQHKLARTCCVFLRHAGFTHDRFTTERRTDVPFFDYAIQFWGEHARAAAKKRLGQTFLFERLLFDE